MSCPIYVTAGAARLRWARITDTTGDDISADPVKVALVLYPLIPGDADWQDPHDHQVVDTPDHPGSVVRASMLIDNTFDPGVYRLWSKLTDDPEVDPEPAGVIVLE